MPDKAYWENRWQEQKTGWDIGFASKPLKEYIDQLSDKNLKILIPGCGNAYEAEYLFNKGFKNVYVMDISLTAIASFRKRVPNFPESHILNEDFFQHQGQYDCILEQTFFCALDPALRPNYVEKMYELLTPDGRLAGLLFDDPLNEDHPPFGGSAEEYRRLFEPYFHLKTFEKAYNSIPPRAGREIFMIAEKKAFKNP
jgi:thiopurine S-methyltransferase